MPDQITINLTDSIPPINQATIDLNGDTGNTYNKEQLDAKMFEYANSSFVGIATLATVPAVTVPDQTIKYEVLEVGIYTNFLDVNSAPIEILATDFEDNGEFFEVYIYVSEGIATKVTQIIQKGDDGKDQYQSYLDTTTDNPPKTEAEWAVGISLEPFSNEGIRKITDWNYPLVEVPTTEIRQNIALAIKEIYIKNADFETNDYVIKDFRRSQDLGSGYLNNRYEITIHVVTKGTTTLVGGFTKVINDYVEPIGLDLWDLDGCYVLVDWSKFPNKTGYSVATSLINRLSERCSDLQSNLLIENLIINRDVEPFTNLGIQAITDWNYPFVNLPTTEIWKSVALAIKGVYVKIYDSVSYDFILTTFRRSQDLGGAYPNNRYEINIAVVNKGTTTFVNEFYKVINGYIEPNGLDLWDLGSAYVLVDWTKFPNKTGFSVATSLTYKLSGNILSANFNNLIRPLVDKSISTADYFKDYRKNIGEFSNVLGGVYVQNLPTKGMTIKNAEDVGILPTNTAAQNSTAINAAISGGNVFLKVTKGGIYQIGNSIEVENNTVIWNERGVSYKKTVHDYAFINKGARTRTANSNIEFHNLEIDSNNTSATISGSSYPALATYGLRGCVSLFNVTTFRFTGYVKIFNDADVACQFANWEDGAAENVYVESTGDGFHFNAGKKFRGKNFEMHTADDAIPFNASDWINSTPCLGDVSDIVIENYKDYHNSYSSKYGQTMRALVGAWIDYYNGVSVMLGDSVVRNGYLYRVHDEIGQGEKISLTPPTLTTEGLQADAGGFYWKFAGVAPTKYKAEVYDTLINGVQSLSDNRNILRMDCDRVSAGYGRAIHPDVTDLPSIMNVNLMNVYKPTSGTVCYAAGNMDGIKFLVRIIGVSKPSGLIFSSYANADGRIEIHDADLTNNIAFGGAGVGSTLVVLNCKGDIKNSSNDYISGKLITDANVEVLPSSKVEGGVAYLGGKLYKVKNTNWVIA